MCGRLRLVSLLAVALASAVVATACFRPDREVTITGQPVVRTASAAKVVGPPPPKPLPEPGTAVVRTPTGVLGVWLGVDAAGGRVRTPCGAEATVRAFEVVRGVDVVLDPGHGGLDPGATSSTGITEAELNLDIARRVRDLLATRGITAELTRDGDWFRSIADRAELGALMDARAFVSIHHNGGSHPPQRLGPGSEVYHERDDPDSRRLGGVVWESLVGELAQFDIDWVASEYRGVVWRVDRDGDDFYGVLRRADTMPAIIVEAAYLTGDAEAELLATEEFRDAEALGIAKGIEQFLRTDAAGDGYIDGFTLGGSARSFDMDKCEDPPLE